MWTRGGENAAEWIKKEKPCCPEYTVASISHSSIKTTSISAMNVHVFSPLLCLGAPVPLPVPLPSLVVIVIVVRLRVVVRLFVRAQLARLSLLPVVLVVLQLVVLLPVVGIIRLNVCGPAAVVVMSVVVVMVVVMVPLSCSPIVVDLGLVWVALDRERAPAPGLHVRSVFSRKQLHVGGLLVAHVVLVFVVGLCWSTGAGAVVVVMMVVVMMAGSLWLTTKEPLLLLGLLLHFLFFLLLLSRLLCLGLMLLLVLLRSFSLGGGRRLAFLFILYMRYMTWN